MTGRVSTGRYGHTATLLPDGRVLVAGGYRSTYLSRAELYQPSTGTWAITDDLHHARTYHSAAYLPHLGVFVAGGYGHVGDKYYVQSAEIWVA